MTMTPIRRYIEPSYSALSPLVGTEVTVMASVLDGGGVVSLTLDWLSAPVTWGGAMTYSLRLTAPEGQRLSLGRYEVVHPDCSFVLSLFPMATGTPAAHYEAYLSEPV
jgi:hypothetical protein